jgi:hypothetical protein
MPGMVRSACIVSGISSDKMLVSALQRGLSLGIRKLQSISRSSRRHSNADRFRPLRISIDGGRPVYPGRPGEFQDRV